MKMICNKAKTCAHEDCSCATRHEHDCCCDEGSNVCWAGKMCECVPVKPKRKPVTVWRVYVDHTSREDARQFSNKMRVFGWKVRGPVKVVVP